MIFIYGETYGGGLRYDGVAGDFPLASRPPTTTAGGGTGKRKNVPNSILPLLRLRRCKQQAIMAATRTITTIIIAGIIMNVPSGMVNLNDLPEVTANFCKRNLIIGGEFSILGST
ncbi:hypothetical protein GQX74_012449 [Glossina fuscipes]|nr:hypothetical protein GQX74_012449 [Glossina fuscipes]